MRTPCRALSRFSLSEMNRSTKTSSESMEAMRCCVCVETRPKLDIFRAQFVTVSLNEYMMPTRNPGKPRSLERL